MWELSGTMTFPVQFPIAMSHRWDFSLQYRLDSLRFATLCIFICQGPCWRFDWAPMTKGPSTAHQIRLAVKFPMLSQRRLLKPNVAVSQACGHLLQEQTRLVLGLSVSAIYLMRTQAHGGLLTAWPKEHVLELVSGLRIFGAFFKTRIVNSCWVRWWAAVANWHWKG